MHLPIWSWQLCFKYSKFHFYDHIITRKKISDPRTFRFPVFPFSIRRRGTCINYCYTILKIRCWMCWLEQYSQLKPRSASTISAHSEPALHLAVKRMDDLKGLHILYSYCIQISAGLKDGMYMCREKSMAFLKLLEIPQGSVVSFC